MLEGLRKEIQDGIYDWWYDKLCYLWCSYTWLGS
jgi:hypothetical protein